MTTETTEREAYTSFTITDPTAQRPDYSRIPVQIDGNTVWYVPEQAARSLPPQVSEPTHTREQLVAVLKLALAARKPDLDGDASAALSALESIGAVKVK